MYSTRSREEVIYRDELGWDDVVQVSYTPTRGHPGGMDRPHTGRIGPAPFAEVTWPAAANPEGGHLAPTRYRITVRGRLTKRLASAFEGLDLEPGVGQTALVGEIRDQSHLYGVLDLVRELGLDLLSVERTG